MNKYDTAPHISSALSYVVIYIALMVLLAVTVTLDFYLVGVIGFVAAMAVAVVKALLVGLYFMHLRHSSHLTWVFATAAFMWLAIMASITLSDYLSRSYFPNRLLPVEAASVQDRYTKPPRLEGTGFNLADEGIHSERVGSFPSPTIPEP